MESNIIYSAHRLNFKFSFFSIMISFFIYANFLLIMIKGQTDFKILTSSSKILSILEYDEESTISSKSNKIEEPFFSIQHFEVNFQRILKFSDRQISYFQPLLNSYLAVDEDYKKNVNAFFGNFSNVLYTGTWKSTSPITDFNSQQGDIKIHIGLSYNLYSNQTHISISTKFFEDEFVDNWYFLKIVKGFDSIYDPDIGVFDFEKRTMKGEDFTIYIVRGSLFDNLSSTTQCKAKFKINFFYNPLSDTSESPIINKLEGSIQSSDGCEIPLDISFDLERENPQKDNVNFILYSIIICMLCLSQMFSTIWLNQKIIHSIANSNSLALITVGQNVIWNAYGCLCHFFLAVNNEQYVPHFGIPAFFFFTNFSIFELRLLYNLWKNQNITDLNDINNVRKKLIKFYITFYIFLFLSLFFVTKFYFEQMYIVIAVIVTWLPQIIYNIQYKNRTSMPIITIILNTINKLFIPLYFRGCPENIFKVKTDLMFTYIILGIMAFEIFFMYCQTLCGPLFFLPCKMSTQSHKFYRSKQELLDMKKEFEYSECTICLLPLFASEPLRKIMAQENHESEIEPENPLPEENGLCKSCLMGISRIFLDFHEYHFFKKKAFIVTPCMHAFHSSCLERWLRMKRECPTDRTIIPPIDS